MLLVLRQNVLTADDLQETFVISFDYLCAAVLVSINCTNCKFTSEHVRCIQETSLVDRKKQKYKLLATMSKIMFGEKWCRISMKKAL